MSFKRNEQGLVEGQKYPLTSDGRIDWKALLNVKWLRVKDDKKAEVETRYGKKIKDLDLSTVEDYYLYVTLGGYNEIARLRGFDNLNHHVDFVDGTKAVVTCTIHFISNLEEPNGLTCSGVASGSLYNISPDFAVFMETIAENRAFVRAVRRALNINIVAAEELGPKKGEGITLPIPSVPEAKEQLSGFRPYVTLANLCQEMGISFEKLKIKASTLTSLQSDPTKWAEWKDIEGSDVWTLIGKIKTTKEEKSDK